MKIHCKYTEIKGSMVVYRDALRFPKQIIASSIHATIAVNSRPKNARRVQNWVALYIRLKSYKRRDIMEKVIAGKIFPWDYRKGP